MAGPHFTINVIHIAGKHLALSVYLSRNLSASPETDEAYDEKYVINNIFKYEHKANNKSRPQDTRKQTAIDCLNNTTFTRNSKVNNNGRQNH